MPHSIAIQFAFNSFASRMQFPSNSFAIIIQFPFNSLSILLQSAFNSRSIPFRIRFNSRSILCARAARHINPKKLRRRAPCPRGACPTRRSATSLCSRVIPRCPREAAGEQQAQRDHKSQRCNGCSHSCLNQHGYGQRLRQLLLGCRRCRCCCCSSWLLRAEG